MHDFSQQILLKVGGIIYLLLRMLEFVLFAAHRCYVQHKAQETENTAKKKKTTSIKKIHTHNKATNL